MAGQVFVDGPAGGQARHRRWRSDAPIEVRGRHPALCEPGRVEAGKGHERPSPSTLTGTVCADIGASTGGFTDCMLQNGAQKVYRRGRGLRPAGLEAPQRPPGGVPGADQRPVSHPGTDPGRRWISPRVDVSFISLKLILPALYGLLQQTGPDRLPDQAPVRGRPGKGG